MQAEKMVQITVAEGHTIGRDDVTRDSKGRATKQVKHRYKPGQTLEVEESEAKRLMDSGHAVRPGDVLIPRHKLYGA